MRLCKCSCSVIVLCGAPSRNQAATKLSPLWNQVEPRWNQAGTKPQIVVYACKCYTLCTHCLFAPPMWNQVEPRWNQPGTKSNCRKPHTEYTLLPVAATRPVFYYNTKEKPGQSARRVPRRFFSIIKGCGGSPCVSRTLQQRWCGGGSYSSLLELHRIQTRYWESG